MKYNIRSISFWSKRFEKMFWLIFLALVFGCSFKKIGKEAGKGLSESLIPASDSIGRKLINSIRTELTDETSRKKVEEFLDSVLIPVSTRLKNTTGSIRDSIINQQTLVWADSLVQALTGDHLNKNLVKLQATVVGKTKADIFEIRQSLKGLLTELLGDSTRTKIGLLRDELLGPNTSSALNRIIDTAVTHIVDSAVSHLAIRLKSDINPLIEGNVSFIRKNATALLISLAILAAIIIILIWQNRRKYLRMVAMLTKQIHDIPDQEVYDLVTTKIKNEAVTAGLEPQLRAVLKDNGLIESDAWKKGS